VKLAINRCPIHHDSWSISVDEDDGSGTRLTRTQCCRHWRVVKQWHMDADQLREMVNELECAAEQTERETRKGKKTP